MVLVITGNPGVGKHTIAEEISKENSYELLDINKIAIKAGIIENNQDTLDVDVDKLKSHLLSIMQEKSVLVGHLAPYVIDSSKINSVIVLRKNPYELMKIYEERKYQSSKIKENAGSEILGVIANDSIISFGKKKSFEVDVTNKTPEMILEKIHDIINNQKGSDAIDWLRLIEEKNEIGKFFDY